MYCNFSSSRHILHSGGIDRTTRGICVISAPLSEPAADTKCQFGGFSRASRSAIQRKICKIGTKCSKFCILCIKILSQTEIHEIAGSFVCDGNGCCIALSLTMLKGVTKTQTGCPHPLHFQPTLCLDAVQPPF